MGLLQGLGHHVGIILASPWHHFGALGITLGSLWDHFGITLGSLGHLGITLGSLWWNFGATLGHFAVTLELLESFWGHCGSLFTYLTNMKACFQEMHVFSIDFNGFMNAMK